ncbi:MAG: DUF1501 domain-containing protein [Pseudomonadota bacterium]
MSPHTTPTRRRFLSALGASAANLPLITTPGFLQAAGQEPGNGKILILLELAGGNDGLNTVVPVTDPGYRALRPTIGIEQRSALQLDQDTALHPAMAAMAKLWEEGALRIIEGVGYPNPNRSHFRSIEIWNAGFGAESAERKGWISTSFSDGAPVATHASGLSLGGGMGPLRGPGRFSALDNEESFLEALENMQKPGHAVRPDSSSPLAHVLGAYESAKITGDGISKRLEQRASRSFDFPETEIGDQLRTVARLLEAGVDVSVMKVIQTGYDTHDNQPDQHSFLLGDLSDAIGAFARAIKTIGLWERVTLVTYSEFGRTARENGSAGTDHGTAAPVFAVGGRVAGGFDGKRVSLEKLHEGDLVHTTDYRDLYSAILSDLWDIHGPSFRPTPGAEIRLL